MLLNQGREMRFQVSRFGFQRAKAACRRPQRQAGAAVLRRRTGRLPHAGTAISERPGGERLERAAQPLGGRSRPGRVGGRARWCARGSLRLVSPAAPAWPRDRRGAAAGPDARAPVPRGQPARIELVRFGTVTPRRAGRTVDLDHGFAMLQQESGQAGPIAAGALDHPEPSPRCCSTGELPHLPIAGSLGAHGQLREHTPVGTTTAAVWVALCVSTSTTKSMCSAGAPATSHFGLSESAPTRRCD